jgi:hypothetical protein
VEMTDAPADTPAVKFPQPTPSRRSSKSTSQKKPSNPPKPAPAESKPTTKNPPDANLRKPLERKDSTKVYHFIRSNYSVRTRISHRNHPLRIPRVTLSDASVILPRNVPLLRNRPIRPS